MRNTSFLLVLATAALVCNPGAIADPAQPAPAQPASNAQPAPATASGLDKMICRAMPAKTGSRLGATRQCRTQREWNDIMAQDQREIQKMQARDNLSPQGH
jgi:hypothetical protein